MSRLGRMLDWRMVASLAGLALVVLLGWTVVRGAYTRAAALELLAEEVSRSEGLRQEVAGLSRQVDELSALVDALREQVVSLGGEPVEATDISAPITSSGPAEPPAQRPEPAPAAPPPEPAPPDPPPPPEPPPQPPATPAPEPEPGPLDAVCALVPVC